MLRRLQVGNMVGNMTYEQRYHCRTHTHAMTVAEKSNKKCCQGNKLRCAINQQQKSGDDTPLALFPLPHTD